MLSKLPRFARTALRVNSAAVFRPTLSHQPFRYFSNHNEPDQEIVFDNPNIKPDISSSETMSFQAETRKLLNIVAKNIYTDKEVFIRELLSNCSDALEKQRYAEVSGQTATQSELGIQMITDTKENTLTIFDSGIGMDREQISTNLGTIAKSGSQDFKNAIDQDKDASSEAADEIIGQFGVGFYSSFIVSNHVEVYSRSEGNQGVRWVSDGDGEFEISNVENLDFERGTKIVLRLNKDSSEFSRASEVEKIIRKYSIFNKYPIQLNGENLSNLQAIWFREKREVTQDEYEQFYEHIANTKVPYKFKLHYVADVPLSIKALFYVPSTHAENHQMGQGSEKLQLHLYSRKVLIKQSCDKLIPHYLRFVKGIVDCEDLPLNVSRETYQDSSLIAKLKNVVTRRVLKFLEDEMKRDTDAYEKWFLQFSMFLKEGVMQDSENQEQLLRLMRYHSSFGGISKSLSLDDYVKQMKDGQKKIYFTSAPILADALKSPFMEPFKDSDVPVLIVSHQIDEMVFNQIGTFKGYTFVNIESGYDEMSKDLGDRSKPDDLNKPRLPEEDVTNFCLWLKEQHTPYVGKVTLSKRLTDVPMVLFGQVSASMRIMAQMMQAQGDANASEQQRAVEQMNSNQTLEINHHHPIIIQLNELRKIDQKRASTASKSLLDQILVQSGIPVDAQKTSSRNLQIIDDFLQMKADQVPLQ